MRIMGLDYGSKTIGVAISDPLGLTAQGVEIIRREEENKLRKSLRRIEELVKQYEVEELVLGFPKNMNNTIGERVANHHSLHIRYLLLSSQTLSFPIAIIYFMIFITFIFLSYFTRCHISDSCTAIFTTRWRLLFRLCCNHLFNRLIVNRL